MQQRNVSKHRGSWSPGWLAFDPFIELFRRRNFGRRRTNNNNKDSGDENMPWKRQHYYNILCVRIAMTWPVVTRAGATVAVISPPLHAPCPPPTPPYQNSDVCLLYNIIILLLLLLFLRFCSVGRATITAVGSSTLRRWHARRSFRRNLPRNRCAPVPVFVVLHSAHDTYRDSREGKYSLNAHRLAGRRGPPHTPPRGTMQRELFPKYSLRARYNY